MKAVKGVWTFNDVLTSFPSIYQEIVNFTSRNYNYTGFEANKGSAPVLALCYVQGAEDHFYPYDVYYFEESLEHRIEIGWFSEPFKTIDFGTTEQMVSDEFYAWLVENTVSVENIKINITENGTTTLATAGKYCDRNIDVNVEVSSDILYDAEALAQGTIEGEFVSDKITILRLGAFACCENLTYVSLPNCTTFSDFRHFSGCTNMTAINLPSLATISNGNQTFSNMPNITQISLPSLIKINSSSATFMNCKLLSQISMPLLSGSTIGASCFDNCYKLTKIILGGATLNPLANTNAFKATPIESGTGYIYVPDDLVETYKTATNWSTYADQIKPISELEE